MPCHQAGVPAVGGGGGGGEADGRPSGPQGASRSVCTSYWASRRLPSNSFFLASSIILSIARVCPRTASSALGAFAAEGAAAALAALLPTTSKASLTLAASSMGSSTAAAAAEGSNESKSLGIWYWMNNCMRSCVNFISFVRLLSGKFKTFSSCGLIWMTNTPKSVLSNCMERKAFAKACCSGDSASMASLNSCAVGMVDKSSGMVSSSLFCTMAAYFGSKTVADAILPTKTNIELNCRALLTSDNFAPACPENWCDSQAWRCLSPLNRTRTEALNENSMGCGFVAWAASVTMGAAMLESPPGPTTSSSRLTVPSGLCLSDRRTA
mmetsp:Transcript_122681/g.392811  ORF Transcript_122681/g.392811 Transcript_122681/m.392811 type:complete len:325 (+) Transcript_122681:884-1858(+)